MTTEKTLATDGYYHYIYKITIPETGQYYYGQHSIPKDTITDNYMGSGVELNKIYELSGYTCAKKEICMYAESFEELDKLEKEIIGSLYKSDPLCLNKISGGRSAGLYESRKLGGISVQKKIKESGRNIYLEWYNKLSDEEKKALHKKSSDSLKIYWKTHVHNWKGKKHKPSTIEKMKGPKPQICGEKNGNYGHHWIWHPIYKISFSVSESLYWEYISRGWISGRKFVKISDEGRKRMGESAKKNIGSKRITNGVIDKLLKENDVMPDGFHYGTCKKGKNISEKHKNTIKLIQKELKDKKYIELKPMLEVYEKYGFDKVVEVFNYKYTRNNLVQQFKKYIPYPEYIPNKNTRRFK